jgi:hypothetical protein
MRRPRLQEATVWTLNNVTSQFRHAMHAVSDRRRRRQEDGCMWV